MRIKLSSNNVFQYLFNIGLYTEKDMQSMKAYPINGNSLIISLEGEYQLVVKQENSYSNNIDKTIINEYSLYQFLQSSHEFDCHSFLDIEILHFDQLNSILTYKYSKNYIDLESYYINKKNLTQEVAESLGITLADLHSQTMNSQTCQDFMKKRIAGELCYQFYLPVHLQDRLEPETLFGLRPESYKIIGLYQQSGKLKSALKELLASQKSCCLTHNNLQSYNILMTEKWDVLLSKNSPNKKDIIIKLINWENSSWGDPAWDVGAAISSYLLLWLNSLISHSDIPLEESLRLATRPLEIIQPLNLILARSYISKFPEILEYYPNFLQRVVQFAGFGLIYSIIMMIQSFKGANKNSIYIVQVAKSLLCRPEKSFKSVFGITESELVNF
ncbi:phosphotransferase family protein [Nostoc sp.]|uniref:phosphotransferase family protein n=1 Tax=Nostoc sp. TaxID=1180 RepID=UPI002FF5DDC2